MADFHYYTLTITAKITVPATGGEPTAINITGIPGAARAMLKNALGAYDTSVALPTVAASAAVEVPAA